MKGIYEEMNETFEQRSLDEAIKEFESLFHRPKTRYVIHTGRGGYELFAVAMEEAGGFKRVYAGKRIPRFLNKDNFRVDYTGRNYRLVKINLESSE